MREFRLCLEPQAENPLLAITACRIEKRVNSHARAVIKGRIALEETPRYLAKELGAEWVKLVCYEAIETNAMLEILGFLQSKKLLDGLHKLNVLLHYEELRHLKSFDRIMERLDKEIIGDLGHLENWTGLQNLKDAEKYQLRTMLQQLAANAAQGLFHADYGKLGEQLKAIIGINTQEALQKVMNYASWTEFKGFLNKLGDKEYGADDKFNYLMSFVGGATLKKWEKLKEVQSFMDVLTAKDWDAFEKALAEEMRKAQGFDAGQDLPDIVQAYRHFDILKQQNVLDMVNAINALGYLKSKKILEPLNFLNFLKYKGILSDLNFSDPMSVMKENDFLKKIEQAEILLYGVITRLSLDTKPSSRDIYIELQSGSYLMDYFPYVRTFQQSAADHGAAALTYAEILEEVRLGYEAFKPKENEPQPQETRTEEEIEREKDGKFKKGTDHDYIIKMRSKRILEDSSMDMPKEITMHELMKEKQTQDFILQYKETDWAFIRRLASHFHTFVVPKYTQAGVKFCFGFSFEKNPNEVYINNAVRKREEKRFEGMTQAMIAERKMTAIVLESRQAYEIGDFLMVGDFKYYVYEVISVRPEYEHELTHHYTLYQQEYFTAKYSRQSNPALPGTSLQGVICSTQADSVEVEFDDEELPQKGMHKRFPYRTPYSNNGTGFYMMPDPESKVRVMFPSGDERAGFAVSTVQQEAATPGRMESYENRAITTEENKSLLLAPHTLQMVNIPDDMYIALTDGDGITIHSSKPITLRAAGAITLQSGDKITGAGSGSVTIDQGQTQMKLEGGNFDYKD